MCALMSKSAKICIFMATYNGAKYISEQLKSIERQTIKDWELVISDDGSTDDTLSVIQKFKKNHPLNSIQVIHGPRSGYAENFLSMLRNYKGKGRYFAFSDQDDIWHENKIEKALNILEKVPDNLPGLYCSRTEYVDSFGKQYTPPRYSREFVLRPNFENSLVQCLAGGNSMVFNACALKLVVNAIIVSRVPSHDWWLYQLVTGCGGLIFYDPEPSLWYRQHGQNLIGQNTKFGAKIKRIQMFWTGKFAVSNRSNLSNLLCNNLLLSEDCRLSLKYYNQACLNEKWYKRLCFLMKSRVKRQNWLETVVLYIGVVFKKI